MLFEVLTLFPESFYSFFHTGIIGRAVQRSAFSYRLHNIRRHGEGNYKSVDDYPFSGGSGLLLKYNVLKRSLADTSGGRVIYLSPRGRLLDQQKVTSLSVEQELTLVCGHYEGIDQRFIDRYVDEEISIGDYVLNSGEIAAMVVMEAVIRKLGHVLDNSESLLDESHENGLLEYDQYTRPRSVDGMDVPEVLLSGHAANIKKWMRRNSLENTGRMRPDLLEKADLDEEDRKVLSDLFDINMKTGE